MKPAGWRWRRLTCEMYPGGTWMGGMEPLGDIMGTSAGPGREEKKELGFIYLLLPEPLLQSSVSSAHAGRQTRATHTLL